MAVQQFPVIIRVTSNSEDIAVKVLNFSGVRPFDMWRRMDNAPLEVFTSGGFPYVVPLKLFLKRVGKLRGIRLQKYTSREFSWGLTSWILLLREPSLDWFDLMAIFVKFGTKANKLFLTLVEPRVIKLMNAPTRISVIVVVKRVILSVIVLIPGALGSLMFN